VRSHTWVRDSRRGNEKVERSDGWKGKIGLVVAGGRKESFAIFHIGRRSRATQSTSPQLSDCLGSSPQSRYAVRAPRKVTVYFTDLFYVTLRYLGSAFVDGFALHLACNRMATESSVFEGDSRDSGYIPVCFHGNLGLYLPPSQ